MYYDDEARRFNFLSGLLLGAVLGTGIGLLVGPEAKRKKPSRIRRSAGAAKKRVRQGAGAARERSAAAAEGAIRKVRSAVKHAG